VTLASSGGRITAVLFDIDDTLVDTRGAFRHALAVVAERYLTAEISADDLVTTWRADAGGHYRAFTRGEIGYREQRMRRANELHAMYGGPELDDGGFDAWDEVFEQAFQAGWVAHEDVGEVLDALDAAGIPYGALSNARVAYQEHKLEIAGLSRVPMLVGVDTLGFGKPDPRVFALAAERIGAAPANLAYVGDEYDIDAVAATDAGMLGVWIDRGFAHRPVERTEGDSVVRITSLSELKAVTGF